MKRGIILAVVVIGYAMAQNECFAAYMAVEEDKVFTSDGVIQDGDLYRTVSVYDTTPDHTTVNMTGGTIGYFDSESGLYTYDSSQINISDGFISSLHTTDSSVVNISGGIIGDFMGSAVIQAYAESTINLYGGYVEGFSSAWIELFNSSILNVDGGEVVCFMFSFDTSTVNVHDGRIYDIGLAGHSTVNVYGGFIDTWAENMFLRETPAVNIYGYGFTYEPQAHWRYWDNPTDGYWVSELSGYGPDGAEITWIGLPDPYTSENINLIPEPATILLLALGACTLIRRNNRTIKN